MLKWIKMDHHRCKLISVYEIGRNIPETDKDQNKYLRKSPITIYNMKWHMICLSGADSPIVF